MKPSDDDVFIESDDQGDTPSAFSQSLSRFMKSPKKKGSLDNSCPHICPNLSSYSPSYETLR